MYEPLIWLLAIGLAMDCMTVSIANGIMLKRIHWRTILLTAFCYGFFQALMPAIGWYVSKHFSMLFERWDHWIAFGILAILGGNMIYGYFKPEKARKFNPQDIKIILTLGIATSIDALAIGISFTCLGMKSGADILYPIAIIGLVSLILSIAGFMIGIFARKHFNYPIELLGGLILIGIGCKILISHLTEI